MKREMVELVVGIGWKEDSAGRGIGGYLKRVHLRGFRTLLVPFAMSASVKAAQSSSSIPPKSHQRSSPSRRPPLYSQPLPLK